MIPFQKQPTTTANDSTKTPDLYPGVSSFTLEPKVADAYRKQGMDVTQDLQKLNQAISAGDHATKAQLLNQFAHMTDQVQGGNSARNWLESQRLPFAGEVAPQYGSVGAGQAFYGSIKNGLVDIGEGLGQLAIAGHNMTMAGRGGLDSQGWAKAQKGVADFFDGMKTYVSQDYQKGLASYTPENGVDLNLDFKSAVGTIGSLTSYMLPGLGIAKGASMLGKAGKLANAAKWAQGLTGASSFLQVFPLYQREALASGLSVEEATLYALPVAAINSVIETANVPALSKAMGMSEEATKAAIRKVTLQETSAALKGLAGKAWTAELFVEAAEQTAKGVMGQISKPGELKGIAKLLSTVGRRVKNGFLEQGITEGEEELFQSLVENASKDIFNSLKDHDDTGRFDDPTFGNYAFDAIYGTILGSLMGTSMGTLAQSRQFDPTIFSYVGADVRQGLRKGLDFDQMLNSDPGNAQRLKAFTALDLGLKNNQITPDQYKEVSGKIRRMAEIARDFSGVDDFTDADRYIMYKVADSRDQTQKALSQVDTLKQELTALNDTISTGTLSAGDLIKAELDRNKVARQLGGMVTTQQGQVYAEEARQQERSQKLDALVQQTMDQYTTGVPRSQVNTWFKDNLASWSQTYGAAVDYPDDFTPTQQLTDPQTGQPLVTDKGRRMFRKLVRTGGEVTTPAQIDENGTFVPSQRAKTVDSYSEPLEDLNNHLAIKAALSDPANALQTEGYYQPDNSKESAWILDGQDILNDLTALANTKAPGKGEQMKRTRELANAWLSDSAFLAQDAKYSGIYNDLTSRILAATGDPEITADNAEVIGGDVPLMESEPAPASAPVTAPAATTVPASKPSSAPVQAAKELLDENQRDRLIQGLVTGGEYDNYLFNMWPEQVAAGTPLTPNQQAVLDAATSFDRVKFNSRVTELTNRNAKNDRQTGGNVGTTAPTPQASESDFLAELEQQSQTAAGQSAGEQLSQSLDTAIQLAGAPVGSDEAAAQQLLAAVDDAIGQIEQQYPEDAEQPAAQSADKSTPARRSPSLKESWPSLAPEEQQQAAVLANNYLADLRNPDDFSPSAWSVYQWNGGNGTFKVKRSSFVQFADENVISQPLAQTYFSEEGLGIDQIAENANVSEQDVVDFMLTYPRGEDSVRSDLRKRYTDEFQALTGKQLTKTTAEVVRDLAGDMALPNGNEEISEESQLTAEQVFAALDAADLAAMQEIVGEYIDQFGEDWMIELINNPPGFPPIPQAVEQLIVDTFANSNFDSQNDQFRNVRNYAEQTLGQSSAGTAGTGSVDRGPVTSTESAGTEQRSSPDALERAAADSASKANALADRSEVVSAQELTDNITEVDQLAADIDRELNAEAAADPRVTAATAPYDIEIANLQQQKRRLEETINRRNQGLSELFPEVPRDGNQRNLFQADNADVRSAAEKAIRQDQQMIDVLDRQISEQQELKVKAIEQALNNPQQDLFQQPEPSKLDVLSQKEAEVTGRIKDMLRQMRGTLSANPFLNPEFLALSAEYLSIKFQQGVHKFAGIVRDFVKLQGPVTEFELAALKTAYGAYQNTVDDDTFEQMDAPAVVRRIKLDDVNNDTGTIQGLEPDSARGGSGQSMGEGNVQQSQPATTQPGTRPAGKRSGRSRVQPAGMPGLFDDAALVIGESGNQPVSDPQRGAGTQAGDAGNNERGGGDFDSYDGVQSERSGDTAVRETPAAGSAVTANEKLRRQAEAESIPVTTADKANIDATLPFLMEGQREDVLFAEQRFAKPDGYGVVFTNSTGTGKTYLALGAIKRFDKQGKNNILIVVPNDAVMNEWVTSAPSLGLRITPLKDTKDAGNGIVITTYANFGQNDALATRRWDMTVMDEAHKLMQGQNADETAALSTLRALTYHPDGYRYRTMMENRDQYNRILDLAERISKNSRRMNNDDLMDDVYFELADENKRMQAELDQLRPDYDEKMEANRQLFGERQGESRTRSLFLSATPFAYRENIQWAEGYLFSYPETPKYTGYNEPDGYQSFMIQHFGYRMRYNKLNKPEAEVNTDLLERNFNAWLQSQGVAASRVLDIDSDYQRLFALTPTAIGTQIDEGLDYLREGEDGYFAPLSAIANKRFDYLQRQRLLEAIKAKEAIPLIRKWHELGRKVVLFYDFNQGGGFAPFRFEDEADLPLVYKTKSGQEVKIKIQDLIAQFNAKRPDLVGINTNEYGSPLETLTKEFPNARVYNGLVKKSQKTAAIKDFNNDGMPDANLLIVQSDANAGWSGHDKTGKFPRVLLNLGMPTQPTKSIQQEGRIYRTGQHPESNSMFVYLNTGTGWERIAFAMTIAQRAATAENLGMGELARGLKDAYITGFEESEVYEPGLDEGKGGKQKDRGFVKPLSLFEKAKTFYYGIQKKTAKTKAYEGVDYFATPEPLGLRMVQWAGIENGDRALEPSAGHGAIARWFPENIESVAVEPSSDLFSRMALVMPGKKLLQSFEDLNIINKFNVITMNPPFGTAGKTASDHLEKATTKHLVNGGRVVALVPVGSFNDKFDKWFYGADQKGNALHPELVLSARILLPSSTFGRAGTSVSTQVLIIDRVDNQDARNRMPSTQNIDLRSAENVNELFDRIENLDVRPRPELTVPSTAGPTTQPRAATMQPEATAPVQQKILSEPVKGFHAKNQHDIYVVKTEKFLERSEYDRVNNVAKKYDGYYSSYKGAGATPGFQFREEENARKFVDEINGVEQAPGETPAFQLNQTDQPAGNPSQALAGRLSQAFGVDIVSDAAGYETALAESNTLQRTGGRRPVALRWQGKVYLSPDANTNSLLHEFGGLWAETIRTAMPDLFRKGVELVRDSGYLSRLMQDPYYRNLSPEEMQIEALETAIGDLGNRFVTSGRKSVFRQWLDNMWSAIRKALGLQPAVNLETMTLNDFVRTAVGQMESGRFAASAQPQAAYQLPPMSFTAAPAAPANPAILGSDIKTLDELKTEAENWYKNPTLFINQNSTGSTSSFAGVNPDLWNARQYTAPDKAFIKEITKLTGWSLVQAQQVEYAKDVTDGVKPYHEHGYYLPGGKMVRLASYQIGQALNTFTDLYNDNSNKGKAFKFLIDRMSRWANLETFVGWLDDASGSLKKLIVDVRREAQRRADYVDNQLQPLLEELRTKMAPFTSGWKGAGVPTITLSSYDVVNGSVQQVPVDVPVAEVMAMVRQAQTQESSRYNRLSSVWTAAPTVNQLVRQNPDGSTTTIPRGAVYYDEATGKTHYLNIDFGQYRQLVDRFENGIAAYDGEQEAFAALKALFNNPVAKEMLKEESLMLRPGENFDEVDDYYPLDAFQSGDARQQSRNASRTLDENRRLQQRTGAADALILRDPLLAASSYVNNVRDVMANARLVDNLNNLQTQIGNDYQGPKKDLILSYLGKMSKDLKDHRAELAKRRAEGGIGVWVDSQMRRYTQAVFVNIGLPLKQTATYAAAYGQGIIGDEYLRSGEALGTLARLTGGAYRDWEAPADVDPATGRGLKGTLSGAETQDAGLLRELLGLEITDAAEREAYQREAATLIARSTFRQSLYTGDVEWKDTNLGNVSTKGEQILKGMDQWVNRYGLAAMRRADVAVILSYYVAAKQQARAEGLTEGSAAFRSRVADLTEQTVYATNLMGQVSDSTQLQRSTDWISKMMGLYSGQQQKTLNLVMARLSDWAKTGSEEDWKKLASGFGYGVIANSLWVSIVSAGASALMALLSGDDPNEDWEEQIAYDFVRNVTGTVPSLGSNAADYIISLNDTIYGNESFTNVPALEAFQEGLDAINSTKDYMLEEDEKKRERSLNSAVYNATNFLSKSAGIPTAAVRLIREWSTTDKDDKEE